MTTLARTPASSISALSALIMLWSGREAYPVADSMGYFDSLDLEPGRKLHQICGKLWPGYGEVVRNRKWCIASMAERILSRPDAPGQVVIAGSGYAPLAVEMHARRPELTIFDLDFVGTADKNRRCMELGCCDPAKVHFVPADIADGAQAASRLSVSGWDADAPSLVVIEGVSYYLAAEEIASLANIFPGGSLLLVDYLLHPGHVHFSRRKVPYDIFGVISRHFGMESISTWTAEDLAECVDGLLLEQWSLYDVEMARYGQGLQFPAADMGWIEIAGYYLNARN